MAILPVISYVLGPAPLAAKALVACVLGLALLRPAWAWLACLALVPLGMPLAAATAADHSLAEPLVVAFLAGWLLQEAARHRHDATDDGIDGTVTLALLLALTVAASLAVRLTVLHLWVAFPLSYVGQLFRFLWHDFFVLRGAFSAPFAEAGPWLEGLVLLVAGATLTRRARGVGATAVAFVAYGGAAAALASVGAVVLLGVKAGWATALPADFSGIRTTVVTADVNAAGSYFLIALGAAAGSLAGSRGMHRVWWTAVTALALAGLWLTGSRAALVAAPIAALLVGVPVALRGGVLKPKAVMGTAAVLAIVATAYLVSTQHVRTPLGPALQWRTENGATALRMFASNPVFGVGVGRFFERSYEYASPAWRASVPRENAHNNFLQVLAEMGLLGFTLLMTLLAQVFGKAFRATRLGPDKRLVGLTAGLAASVVTWLAGHPLLAVETAISFWMALGVLAGLSRVEADAVPAPARIGTRRTWVIGVAVLIALSVVPRSYGEFGRSDLWTAGIGLSNWKFGDGGRQFRWMSGRAQVFVPSRASRIAIRFRSPNGLATVKLLLDGHVAARVMTGDTWEEAKFALPRGGWRPFVGVELRAAVAGCTPPADCRVQVGTPRPID